MAFFCIATHVVIGLPTVVIAIVVALIAIAFKSEKERYHQNEGKKIKSDNFKISKREKSISG